MVQFSSDMFFFFAFQHAIFNLIHVLVIRLNLADLGLIHVIKSKQKFENAQSAKYFRKSIEKMLKYHNQNPYSDIVESLKKADFFINCLRSVKTYKKY